ncbi:hypothetical protein JYK14_06715 [Siccirubricoccus sp. KC 17139]|uniref:Uncharacterized protein n=1 Tax=Siccirubricoccus soli TaxID=2899147 RepID=A0ABT1D1R7_9PROT|nr:hypothetical protein [Siccirubricoccus soli]MCO6415867.1 hypothetical protein [Siccirubricoccus soli]MCP2681999.1 hypothetical protein [Siccirubricoccus soli]
MTLEGAIGPIGAAHLRGFASAAAKAFPGLVEQVVLLLPVHPDPDFPHQVAVILRMEPCTQEEEKAVLRKAHTAFGRAALPATMEGHAITVYVVPSYARDWVSQHFPDRAIAVEVGKENG